MADKYEKIDRVFQGLSKLNKETIDRFEKELGREITFEEYLEKFLEDVSSVFLKSYVEGYFKGQQDTKKQGMTIFKGKNKK